MDIFILVPQFAASYYAGDSLMFTTVSMMIGAMLMPIIIAMVVSILTIIGMWGIFKKAGKGGWESIIPVYNIVTMLQITNLPIWYVVLFFIPFAQIYASVIINIELSKQFGQSRGFAILLMFVPFVGYPMLAFGKDKIYMGSQNTNIDAEQGYQPTQYAQSAPAYSQPSLAQQPQNGTPQNTQPVQQPKKQMDPAKKKKVITGCFIGAAVLILGIAAAIILPLAFRVDYSTAYNTVKKLEDKVYDIYQNYDCEYVTEHASSAYYSTKQYNEYIEGCRATFSKETDSLIEQLGNTDGIKRNSEINSKFNQFKSLYDSTVPNLEDLELKLAIYQDWHNFIVAADNLNAQRSSDSEYTTAANYLMSSSNDTLKTYGKSWLEQQNIYLTAYRRYKGASFSDPNYLELLKESNNKKKELSNWVSTNKPDIAALASINFKDTSKLITVFETLYDAIMTSYEQNYNYSSGDCTEFSSKVVCD